MKRALIIGMIMLYAHLVNAQCGNMMSKAQNYYQSKDYANAKVQFQKVVEKCPSNAEIAHEYIILCDRWIKLKEEERTANELSKSSSEADAKTIKELQNRINRLQEENDAFLGTFEKSRKIIVEKDSIIAAKSDTIRCEKERNTTLYSSLQTFGSDLNTYLQKKNKKTKFDSYETTNDALELIEAMKQNLKKAK